MCLRNRYVFHSHSIKQTPCIAMISFDCVCDSWQKLFAFPFYFLLYLNGWLLLFPGSPISVNKEWRRNMWDSFLIGQYTFFLCSWENNFSLLSFFHFILHTSLFRFPYRFLFVWEYSHKNLFWSLFSVEEKKLKRPFVRGPLLKWRSHKSPHRALSELQCKYKN